MFPPGVPVGTPKEAAQRGRQGRAKWEPALSKMKIENQNEKSPLSNSISKFEIGRWTTKQRPSWTTESEKAIFHDSDVESDVSDEFFFS
eukprot:980568-Prorocentrum_minimum.AAC.1